MLPLLKYFGSTFLAAESVTLNPTAAEIPATVARNAPAETIVKSVTK